MTILGLDENRYLVNNPIYLRFVGDIGEQADYLLTITIGALTTEVQMYNNGAYLDVSPFVKAQFPSTPNLFSPNSNIVKLDISVSWYAQSQGYQEFFNDKVFIRGGRYTGINNYLANNHVLKESVLIPIWGGFPANKYTVTGDSIVEAAIPENESELMRSYFCDGVYLTWLNSKGGYSSYLFETFEVSKKYKQGEIIERHSTTSPQNNFYDLGGEIDYSINVNGQIPERHYRLINSLIESPEVWVYKFNELIGDDFVDNNSRPWEKVYGEGNSYGINSRESQEEVSLTFNTNFNKDISLV